MGEIDYSTSCDSKSSEDFSKMIRLLISLEQKNKILTETLHKQRKQLNDLRKFQKLEEKVTRTYRYPGHEHPLIRMVGMSKRWVCGICKGKFVKKRPVIRWCCVHDMCDFKVCQNCWERNASKNDLWQWLTQCLGMSRG